MEISEKDWSDMESALIEVGVKKLGEGKFYIDKAQNEILDHLHWHARPYGWTNDEAKARKAAYNSVLLNKR